MAIAKQMVANEEQWELDVAALQADLQGAVIQPGDEEYRQARTTWNEATERYPAAIVRAGGVADVQAAVRFARERGVPVAVRSGGHSIAGHSSVDDGLVIDLSGMRAIDIDPARRIARIEPGLTWGAVAQAAHAYGLALTSGDTATVGVGGLTLGGGIGWMVRKHGLTIDNLRAVELVTANGRLLRASADEHADLLWGLRGGGGNFGIATAFEFNLHPAGMVVGGGVVYDAANAADVLRAYAAYASTAPDELTTMAILMCAPPAPFIPPAFHGAPVLIIAACYAGDLAVGEAVVAPLRRLAAPIADLLGPMPYPAMFALTAEAERPGLRHVVRSAFLNALGDDALEAIVSQSAAIMSPGTIVQIRVLGGAMSRVPADATAFAHRDKPFLVMIANYGPDADELPLYEARTEQVWQAIRPHAGGVYANFLADEGEARVREAYPRATFARLARLKAYYDPDNLFRRNQNIAPAR
jgi:FAD/FMN-containing dehydrogenase